MLLATIISILMSLDVDVDTCAKSDTCYRMSSRLFRDATTLVAQYGTIVEQNKALTTLDSLNTVTRSNLVDRIKFSDEKMSKQDTIIAANKKHVITAYVVGGAVGYVLGLITVTFIVLGVM